MATSKTAITEGSGLNVATNTISEDAVTKHLQRVVLNNSSGVEASPATATTVIKDVTLSLDTSIYAATDLAADTQQVDAALRISDGTGILQSVMVIDQDDQVWSGDLYIMDANQTMGTENSAPSISDANALVILGIVSFLSTDFKDLGGVKVASRAGIGLPIKAVSGTDDIYVALVLTTGTPTFTASGIKLRLGILQD